MTMTLHVLHAGDGYSYLTDSIAKGDVPRASGDPMVDYYTAKGNPPGQWIGSGIGDLGMSGEVTEEQMLALYGEGLRPDANEYIAAQRAAGKSFTEALASARLGRRFYQYGNQNAFVAAVEAAYRDFEKTHHRRASVEERREIKRGVGRAMLRKQLGRSPGRAEVAAFVVDELAKAKQPVAALEVVFTDRKSSQMFMLDDTTRPIFMRVHDWAVRGALAYGEAEAAYTRVGKDGIAQVRARGFVATAYTHWDSRSGDPNLHTHVPIANRVRTDDGVWRTLDSKQLHGIAVSMSEMYNALMEQGLTEALGVRFVEVPKGPGKRPTREIEGMPLEWIKGFSRRRTDIEAKMDELVADYVRRHGKTPPRTAQIRLAQQATLETRPDKQLRSLAELVDQWRTYAAQLLPDVPIEDVIQACVYRTDEPTAGAVDLAAIAAKVVAVVSMERSTWNVYHIRSEAIRALKPLRYPSAQARIQAIETVVGHALGRESILLAVEPDAVPRLLRKPDGESVFHRRGSDLYTSQEILDAETRIVEAADTERGPVVPRRDWQAAIRACERDSRNRTILNPGQRALVGHLVGCGLEFARGVGPPGTGKSTAMRAVRQAWETTGGRVIGLAPSAAAASVLADELGIHADTIDSLIVQYQESGEVDVHDGDMLLIDEAGMAGTRLVDLVREIAAERGAVVRAIGDPRQLPAVGAGGWLRLLDVLAVPGVELTEVHRFLDETEADAMLRLRVGDETAIPWYEQHGRLHGGPRAAVLDQLYADWQADLAADRTAIMISDSADVARELSARAQLDRRAAGLCEQDGIELHDQTVVGVGDRIVTRLNRRRLAVLGAHDFVKNGDYWQVTKRFRDGRLRVRHVRHHGEIVLPAWYVKGFVELGYAATVHRSQGLTVDVARSFLTSSAYREAALVALSRGIEGNHAYLDTDAIIDPDEPEVLPGDLSFGGRIVSDEALALSMILRREGAERSATEELRAALDMPYRLNTAIPEFDYGREVYRGRDGGHQAEAWVRAGVPRYADAILADDAWPALAAVLHEVHDGGVDPARLLARRAAQRALTTDPSDPARSVAKVLHYRVVEDMPDPAPVAHRPPLLPGWVASPPSQGDDETLREHLAPHLAEDLIEVGEWLRSRAERIASRVEMLGERAAENTPIWSEQLGPVPDDPAERAVWIARAGQVGAYRERWQVADDVEELLPGGERGEQARARAWVLRYLVSMPIPAPVSSTDRLAARTASLRERLDHLSRRITTAVVSPLTAQPAVESELRDGPHRDFEGSEPPIDPTPGAET